MANWSVAFIATTATKVHICMTKVSGQDLLLSLRRRQNSMTNFLFRFQKSSKTTNI